MNRTLLVCLLMVGVTNAPHSALAQTFTVLHTFTGVGSDGAVPVGGLTLGADGNLYGSTQFGGGGTSCSQGCGTIFKMSTSGAYTDLSSFFSTTNERLFPSAPVVYTPNYVFAVLPETGAVGPEGSLWGFSDPPNGYDVCVFDYGNGVPSTGITTGGAIVLGNDGNLYGTTLTNDPSFPGYAFKTGSANGRPNLCPKLMGAPGFVGSGAPLVQGNDGNFYGVTPGGGAFGSIFRLTPSSGSITTVYAFTGGADGGNPAYALVKGLDGNFYGTTSGDGVQGAASHGTIFKVTPGGTLTTLYTFSPTTRSPSAAFPSSPLVQGSDGLLYGTTFGGSGIPPTVFALTPQGAITFIYIFPANGSIVSPSGSIVVVNNNDTVTIYGTTQDGGASGNGVVYKLVASVFSSDGPMPEWAILALGLLLFAVVKHRAKTSSGKGFRTTGV